MARREDIHGDLQERAGGRVSAGQQQRRALTPLTDVVRPLLPHVFFCSCSFGEFVAPNKTLHKNDQYQGHWKDGRMHGPGTYRWVGTSPSADPEINMWKHAAHHVALLAISAGMPAARFTTDPSWTACVTATACCAAASSTPPPPASSSASGCRTRRPATACSMTSQSSDAILLETFLALQRLMDVTCSTSCALVCLSPEGRSSWDCGRTTSGRAPAWSSLSSACTTREPSKITG